MKKDRYLWLVSTKPKPGKEKEYNKWYDEHIAILFAYKGMKRVSRNVCTVPLGETGENSPRYITIYEVEKKGDIEGVLRSPQMKEAEKQFKDWDGLGEVVWSGWYEPVKSLERGPLTSPKRYMEIAGAGPKPGHDVEYLDYYMNHFTNMFEYRGIRKVSYSRRVQRADEDRKSPGYVTVYDFESREVMEAFYKDPIFTGAGKEWEEVGKPVMDLQFAGCYESVIILER